MSAALLRRLEEDGGVHIQGFPWQGDGWKKLPIAALCANLLALREDVAREKILGQLYAMLKSPAAILRMRKRVVERLSEEARGMNTELEERRTRLARTEEKIARFVEFISEGQQSDYVVKSLHDLEAQAAAEKKEIARLKEETAKPIDLPGPDFFIKRAQATEDMLAKDPLRGREQLHRLFEGGQLKLYPQLTGSYVAEGQFYPLGILGLQLATGTDGHKRGRPRRSEALMRTWTRGPVMVARVGFESSVIAAISKTYGEKCDPSVLLATSRDVSQHDGSHALDLGVAAALATAARALVAGGIVDEALPLLDRLERLIAAAYEAEGRELESAIERALRR